MKRKGCRFKALVAEILLNIREVGDTYWGMGCLPPNSISTGAIFMTLSLPSYYLILIFAHKYCKVYKWQLFKCKFNLEE